MNGDNAGLEDGQKWNVLRQNTERAAERWNINLLDVLGVVEDLKEEPKS